MRIFASILLTAANLAAYANDPERSWLSNLDAFENALAVSNRLLKSSHGDSAPISSDLPIADPVKEGLDLPTLQKLLGHARQWQADAIVIVKNGKVVAYENRGPDDSPRGQRSDQKNARREKN